MCIRDRDKTVVVAVRDSVRHPLYKKIVKRTVKFKAHDEANSCGIGDKVAIMETRRLSADKNWRVVEILERPSNAAPSRSLILGTASTQGTFRDAGVCEACLDAAYRAGFKHRAVTHENR